MKKSWHTNLSPEQYRLRKKLAKQARKFLKDKCEMCQTTDRLQIHHVNRDWSDNSIDNLMTLCSACHMKWHHERGHIVKDRGICLVDDCGRFVKAYGLCEKHWDRYRIRGTIEKYEKKHSPCIVCGTPYKPLFSRGELCNIHRKIKYRHGDPFFKITRRSPQKKHP